jgi:hypothetical protein
MTLFALVRSLKRQHASQVAGFAVVIIAATALIGCWAGLPQLYSWGSAFPPMTPSAALSLGALGLALVRPGKDSRFAFAVGLVVAAIATGSLGLILLDLDPRIDPWLASWAAAEGPGAISFRTAKVAAVALGLAGGSLALGCFERHRLAATMLGSIVGTFAVFALLGYLSGIDTLYGSAVSSPALPATVGLLCVAVGMILRTGMMPVFRKPRPLWHLLVMLGCAIIAPLLLYGAYAGFRITDAQLGDVRENLAIEARTLSANIDREVIGEIDRLQALAASASLRQSDFAEFQHQAQASLALRRSGNIVLIDRNMQQLVNTAVPFGKALPKAGAPEVAERTLATGQPQASDLFWAPVTQRLLVTIIVPVQMGGENRYALARSPERRTFVRLVAAKELPAGWQAVISDGTHRIIAQSENQSGNQSAFIGQELPPALWHHAEPGVYEFVNSAGRPSLGASTKSELTGWETAVWAPKALLEAPVRAQWRTLGAMALLAIALVTASAFWLGRTIARSVGHAARTAIALGEGGPMPVSGTPVAEVDTLMAELRGAAARRQAAEHDLQMSKDQLQVSKDRLQLAFNATRLGWCATIRFAALPRGMLATRKFST